MRIPVELSAKSMKQAARQLVRYADSLGAKCDELSRRLAEIGVTASAQSVRLDTGNLAASIRMEKDGECAYLVFTDEDYAAFVEFGTGVVGQGTYKGQLPAGYGYDERRTPEAHDPLDPAKWYYYDAEGRVRGTRGQTADGFMLAGAEVMRQMVLPIAKEVFRT